MKLGVRRKLDDSGGLKKLGKEKYDYTRARLNSQDRTIKRGTEIQNISSRKLDPSKMERLYASYTKFDNDSYGGLMGNVQYGGKGYKNTFLAKKDIKVPSDRKTTEIFLDTVKKNPEQVINDMTKAYNNMHIFATTSAKVLTKKLSEVNGPDGKVAQKLAKDFISYALLDPETKSTANLFYTNVIKNGYDAISDANDRDRGAQDPLIVINTKSLKGTGSLKLQKKDLDAYSKYALSREHNKRRKNLSEVQD